MYMFSKAALMLLSAENVVFFDLYYSLKNFLNLSKKVQF